MAQGAVGHLLIQFLSIDLSIVFFFYQNFMKIQFVMELPLLLILNGNLCLHKTFEHSCTVQWNKHQAVCSSFRSLQEAI